MKIRWKIILWLLSVISVTGIILAVLWMGNATFSSMYNIFTPPPPGEMRAIDWYNEFAMMKSALNWALPIGVLSLLAKCVLDISTGKINYSFLLLSFVSLFSVSSCCIMFFQFMVYAHEGILLWNGVWWTFAK